MKWRMLRSPLWKIGSWKKMFLCGKKSLEKPTVEHQHEIIQSEVLKRLHATVELPREIIEWEILPRLPLKYLAQFMRVCKQWRSLISSGEFTKKNLHYLENKQSLTRRKVIEIDWLSNTFTTRDCDDLNNHDSPISIPFVNIEQEVKLLASLDGLVFVKLPESKSAFFWNPLTGAYKKFSDTRNSYFSYDVFGFYFNSYKKEYMVLQVICDGPFKTFIYSQRLNSKKEIQWLDNQQRLADSVCSDPVSFGESLYFMGKQSNLVTKRYLYWIIVFDVKSESFREISFPLLNQENTYKYGGLMVIEGCIHIFFTRRMKCDGELWRMDGDGDGWTKVKDPLMYEEKIDMEHLEQNCSRFIRNSGSKVIYLETLVSPNQVANLSEVR